ncbi:unnamed protein product (macronuclear) [Paramecium tetraurelia]|uniref:HTH psq-type domain-containing protein n=1 Tax=Paramecium tetraurelia TaxID=5888 RepID=A0CXQ9_PARTE|nr:uncharacterized protein GSPATT00011208001 [Paramecium tetraurelia]CAK75576.1 unnamed protein product [Paramecium tetraurelia]|eukprot:XP_001442973.1 hypothetical protein (macronuclear) [Paramecium tetraurelia strain d4-2]
MASIEQLSKVEDHEQIPQVDSSTPSHESDSSDSSYDFAQDLNQKPSFKRSPEEEKELLYKYRGKHGLKYAKISNEQRQKLIKQVTTTGCTIKSAAKELNINFSTAKAIMQIYRKEGRTSKKIKRDNKKTLSTKQEILNQTTSDKPNYDEQRQTKVDVVQDNLETNLYQQAEETNRNQALLIQQLNTQNMLLSGRVQQLQQEKQQLNQNFSYLTYQYNQLQQMMSQMVPSYYRPYP